MTNDSSVHSRSNGTPSHLKPNGEAERQLLGSLILSPEEIPSVVNVLEHQDVKRPMHFFIYAAVLSLWEEGVGVDLPSVTQESRRIIESEQETRSFDEGPSPAAIDLSMVPLYVTDLTSEIATTSNASYWAHLVKERSILLKQHRMAKWLQRETESPDVDPLGLHQDTLSLLHKLTSNIHGDRVISVGDLADQEMGAIRDSLDAPGGIIGLPTGFTALDSITGGCDSGSYVIIAARPSMGKTGLALSIALNMAKGGHGVYIHSAEMGSQSLGKRLLSMEARVNLNDLRKGKRVDAGMERLDEARKRLHRLPIFIDDTPSPTIDHIRGKAHQLKAQEEIEAVFVDYLQLMKPRNTRQPRERQITEISSGLKGMGMNLDLLMVALSQLNRSLESRNEKRPRLSDLRESGSLEQDADLVCFIHRAERYGVLVDEDGNSTEGRAEIIVGKQRNGPIGSFDLAFQKKFARFDNLSPREPDEDEWPDEESPF